MNSKIVEQYENELIDAILHLQSHDEAKNFIEDLCTMNERTLLGQRFAVAKMLRDNKTYQEIAHETGASTATISRVSRALNYGKNGYESIINRMEKENNA